VLAVSDQAFGHQDVGAFMAKLQDVARCACHQRDAEGAAQVGHTRLQRVRRRRRRGRTPDQVDESVGVDDLAAAQRQRSQ
jgi:hypothetical protein